MGRFVLVLLASGTALAWLVLQMLEGRGRWQPSLAYVVILLSMVLVLGQLMPLPGAWLEFLAPRHAELLPAWTSGSDFPVHLGSWETISLTPNQTRVSLAVLWALSLVFIVVANRVCKPPAQRRHAEKKVVRECGHRIDGKAVADFNIGTPPRKFMISS